VTEPSNTRPGVMQWFLFLLVAVWLAAVPPAVTALVSVGANHPPDLFVALGLMAPTQSALPLWAMGLIATVLSLAIQLLGFVPFYLFSRRPGREFLRVTAGLAIAISLYQTANAIGRLPWVQASAAPPAMGNTYSAALRLALALPFLLFGLGWIEVRRRGVSLRDGWRQVGLRLWLNPQAAWLGLASAAIVVWPWVVVGSLGSGGTTAANALQALPNALDEEILFRGFVLAWLWRTLAPSGQISPGPEGRRGAAIASILLFVAAQGGTILPHGDLNAFPRFFTALALGLFMTELTIRAGGSIWPAVGVHFAYDWFHLAFVDPRSQEEIFHWLAQGWAVVALGALGLLFWLGRRNLGVRQSRQAETRGPGGRVAMASFAGVSWAVVLALYLIMGEPGLHPDGFLIFLGQQSDLSQARAIADPVERRTRIYQTLVDTAEQSQAPIRAELDKLGVSYHPHYLMNVIEVLERPGLRRRFAREPGVASVLFQAGVRPYSRSSGVPAVDTTGPTGVGWNVHAVGADRVWNLGYTGQGIVVGSADTGVDWQHPALKNAYLGWNGTAADHNYHWYDPWDGTTVPFDDSGHGTHTTGTMVGQDGENKIGLAPGAKWIACRNMRHGIGNPGGYLSCMEFLLAPFPLGGDSFHDGDPSRGAEIVNNSWGCPIEEGCQPDTLSAAVDRLREAGQMMVVSAGNDGPACGTVQDPPALYGSAFSVGAIKQNDVAATFSSRGPVTANGSGILKPDIAAPGVNVRSAVPGGYASLAGTSMAGPHVAGAAALLWSADPSLVGDIDRTESLLTQTAQRLHVDAVCPPGTSSLTTVCACDSNKVSTVPNDVYGWGMVDAWAAAQQIVPSH
jgi:membrane protease YdiL (CAAX protease family)